MQLCKGYFGVFFNGSFYRARIKTSMTSKPNARLAAQARNMVSKLLISAINPMTVGPAARPTWKKQVGIAIDSDLLLAEEKSAAMARLTGMAIPMPMPKIIPMMINCGRLWKKEKRDMAMALITTPLMSSSFLLAMSANLPAGARNKAELA